MGRGMKKDGRLRARKNRSIRLVVARIEHYLKRPFTNHMDVTEDEILGIVGVVSAEDIEREMPLLAFRIETVIAHRVSVARGLKDGSFLLCSGDDGSGDDDDSETAG